MPIVKIQYRRQFAAAPSIGSWGVVSSAWFDAPTAVPTTTVRSILQRFFNATDPTGVLTGQWHDSGYFDLGLVSTTISAWSYSSGSLTHEGDFNGQLQHYISTTPRIPLPSQAAIAVGYRVSGMVPVQRGRSRFWIGPTRLAPGAATDSDGGGLRLTEDTVDTIANHVAGNKALLDAQGWVLQVKSGPFASATFAPADELYVDDVIDVMRSRRAWQSYQARVTI